MTRFRSTISMLLGLLLLVQGLAVSAATPTSLAAMTPAAGEHRSAAAASTAGTPCHKQIAEPASPVQPADHCPCCDGGCPDLQACAMAHPALPSSLVLNLPVPGTTAPIAVTAAVVSQSPAFLLRPPIHLRG